MIGNKIQPYTYSLKTAASTNALTCGFIQYCYIVPPEDALSIENLRTHFIFKFHEDVPEEFRIVRRIGIVNTMLGAGAITYKKVYDVNKVADANRVVDFEIDLSKLLKKDNIEFWSDFNDYPENATFVYVELDPNVSPFWVVSTNYIGEVLLWKIDALFTTKEIR